MALLSIKFENIQLKKMTLELQVVDVRYLLLFSASVVQPLVRGALLHFHGSCDLSTLSPWRNYYSQIPAALPCHSCLVFYLFSFFFKFCFDLVREREEKVTSKFRGIRSWCQWLHLIFPIEQLSGVQTLEAIACYMQQCKETTRASVTNSSPIFNVL